MEAGVSLPSWVKKNKKLRIKVLGIGGGGNKAVDAMIAENYFDKNVTFISVNTDEQDLEVSLAKTKIQLGKIVTKGEGAGCNPEIGRKAADESFEAIKKNLTDADIIFLVAGLGGGTGTGAVPVIAKAVKELGILSVAVVTMPFDFEGPGKRVLAESGLAKLRKEVDTTVIVENTKLVSGENEDKTMVECYALSDNVLKDSIKAIVDIIDKPGRKNIDPADLKRALKGNNLAIIGMGRASGKDKAVKATAQALQAIALGCDNISGASYILSSIASSTDISARDNSTVKKMISSFGGPGHIHKDGTIFDDKLGDEIIVYVILTGISVLKNTEIEAQDNA